MRSLISLFILPVVCLAQYKAPDKPRERMDFFYEERSFPNPIPAGARAQAVGELNRRRAAAIKAGLRTAEGATWKQIGPKPTSTPGDPRYSTSGRVSALAIDPRDNDTVYAGAASGGVWKTQDGGITWIPLTDDQPSLATGSIAIDPKSPDTVYVGTGENTFSASSYYGAGILKSTDGGQTWRNIVGPFLRARIGSLVIHPQETNILVAAVGSYGDTPNTPNGIYRSSDAGETWTNVLTGGQGTGVVFHPTNPNTMYAALGTPAGGARNGIYRSEDAGATWRQVGNAGAGLPAANIGRITLAVTRGAPSNLYASIGDARGDLGLGLYRSTDQGATWTRLSAPEFCGQCWYANTLDVHPLNPDVILAGGLNIIRSIDGGVTWRTLLAGSNRVGIHVDQHSFEFTADGKRLYVGNDGGVWTTADAEEPGLNWTHLNQSLAITQFYAGMAIHPTDPEIGLGGTQDNGPQLYAGSAGWSNQQGCDGAWNVIDQATPSVYFFTCQQLLRLLRTGGFGSYQGAQNLQHGLTLTDRVRFIPPFVGDPVTPTRLFFGTFRLYRTLDSGGLWSPISPDLTFGRSTISTIAVSESDTNVIYTGAGDGRIMVTANAGDGANARWTERVSGVPGRAVTHITVDPLDAGIAYATFSGFPVLGEVRSGRVYRTTDGGATWIDISGNLPNIPVNDIVVDPDLPNTLYIATDAGVLFTRDGGQTWGDAGSGLPRVVALSLVLHRPSRTLRVATHGRSVWDLSLPVASSRPVVASLTPPTANAGSGTLQLTIRGTNFGPGSQVLWNGQVRNVTTGSNTQLVATITASDVAAVGRASVVVLNPSSGGGVSIPANFNIGPDPVVVDAAFANAAFPVSAPVAPGSIVTLYGSNLAPRLAEAVVGSLPFTLGDTAVILGGIPVPLYFVSPGQLSFQVPWTASTNGNFPLTVVQHGRSSTGIQVRTVPFAPGLFATNQAGSGQGAIRISGVVSIAAPVGAFPDSRPAKPGETIQLYGTGLGAVANRPATGAPASATVLARTLTDPTVMIGGQPATVSFSGLAPGTVGLYQINVLIPATTQTGDAVPIQVTIGGVTSNTVTAAIAP